MITKKQVLKELLELVKENYFKPYFEDRKEDNLNNREAIIDFLECRIIELETDNTY